MCHHVNNVFVFQSQFTPSEVVQWSNHRVMEWLRSVDLAEYAPNLRGSGVHGGLIVSTSSGTAMAARNNKPRNSVWPHVSSNRCWSLALTQTLWPCCWTFPLRKRCWGATLPPTSTTCWASRLSRRRGSTPKRLGTLLWTSQPKSRWGGRNRSKDGTMFTD